MENPAQSAPRTPLDNVTALVTVYHKVPAKQLDECLNSLWEQTRPPAHVVLVEDGVLGEELERTVVKHERAHENLTVIRCAANRGSGLASREGMAQVHTEWVARLDADDIARADRLEKQCALAAQREREGRPLDVIGTALAEFEGSPEQIVQVRTLPQTHTELAKYVKINSPINNPSVLLRVSAVERAGGYRHVQLMEDYDLYARLMATGARFENMPEPLTLFRADGMFDRRTSKGIVSGELAMQKSLVELGLVSRPRAAANFVARTAFRLLPVNVMSKAYKRLFVR